ncbi:MAG: DUF2029 domain-containing protein [Bacteroidia bacterium]
MILARSTHLLSGLLYALLLYGTLRSDFVQVWGLFGALFAIYAWHLYRMGVLRDSPADSGRYSVQEIVAVGLLLRLVAVFALPNLSDDYFRFVWDGRLLIQGVNPYEALPSAYLQDPARMQQLGLTQALYDGLNSKDYFSVYPPVLQGIFWVAARLFPTDIYGAVLVMKAFIWLAEAGSLLLFVPLLRNRNLPHTWLALYAWNPLVIAELCGNVHFEALMICSLLLVLYLLDRGRWPASAVAFAVGISAKLLPLMLLPLLPRRLGWGRAVLYGLLVGGVALLFFLPLFDWQTLQHLGSGVDLYFRRFEFNASIYYIVRWVGYQVVGWNIIRSAGPWLAVATVAGMLLYMLLERKPSLQNLPQAMSGYFLMYFALTSIVHPWYITTLVALGVLHRYRYPQVWSLLILTSYFTYRSTAYTEALGLTAASYMLLAAFIGYEWYRQRR